MFEELWKFTKAHYAAKRYHLVLGNIQLLISLFNQQLLNNLTFLQEVFKSLQEIFIKLDTLALEFHFYLKHSARRNTNLLIFCFLS